MTVVEDHAARCRLRLCQSHIWLREELRPPKVLSRRPPVCRSPDGGSCCPVLLTRLCGAGVPSAPSSSPSPPPVDVMMFVLQSRPSRDSATLPPHGKVRG